MKPYSDGELYKTAIEIFASECCSPAVFDIAHNLPLSNDTKQIPELHFEEDSDILIAGAGVFGCAFGYAMAQLGHKVTIIEKDIHNNTSKLLGEYLQPGGILALEKLGMKGSFTSNLSSQIVSKELWKRRDMSSTTTTRTAKQLNRLTIIPGNVTRIVKTAGIVVGFEYENGGKQKARLNVIADGGLSKLRSQIHQKTRETRFSYFIGCVLEDCPQTREDYADIILTDSSPILVYRISKSQSRLFVDVVKVPTNIPAFIYEEIIPRLPG
ncbi:squalene monooxygenase-like [Octopus sinensis]|uniref:Squalene monooxygenase n=1 Tax=Octopus sinensis TaxID=2607531 RepID=A0A7E6EJ87_9MOLL|nr:squalene monooxygenase-like [Octopus sinensis]